MVKIVNCGFIEFGKIIQNKVVVVYGAGRALDNCLETYLSDKDVDLIVDSNERLWGQKIIHRNREVNITSLENFINIYKTCANMEQYMLVINSTVYAAEIVEMLDQIPELAGLNCCVQALIMNKREAIVPYEFTRGTQKIPKKIHYIWVGGHPLPEEYIRNIETWRKYNPDYEIIQWDESNYNFNKCEYIKDAYEKKAWGFVPNYARLDIIYEHGGIYLDTDVEVVGNLDCLLNDTAFFNMGRSDRVNQGCGFGAKSNNKLIGEMRTAFEQAKFVGANGTPTPCHSFVHPVLRRYGFVIKNQYQKIQDIALYPCDVMSPLTIEGMENYISSKTRSIHKEAGTWRSEKEKIGINKLRGLLVNRT